MAADDVGAELERMAENAAFLKAIEEQEVLLDILDQLPEYEALGALEAQLQAEKRLDFHTVFHEPTGYYQVRAFLISDYAGDKAVFVKDIETYKRMRFESARRKVARLLYYRFVAEANSFPFPEHSSVFDLIKQAGGHPEDVLPMLEANAGGTNGANGANTGGTTGGAASGKPAHPSAAAVAPGDGSAASGTLLQIGETNGIGVYGESVEMVREAIQQENAPKELFDDVLDEVMNDLQHDVYPRFVKSKFFKQYIRTKAIETMPVFIEHFEPLRLLGRGGFGSVHACRKRDSGKLYAMKQIHKKLVKVKNALVNVMEERDVLAMLDSPFVTNLKYALQDEDNLYLIMDLMLGGDLKYHLINSGRFEPERARHYAAEVLLGLEHLHSLNIIYRDLKLENVLLDADGHAKLSDLGLAVVTKHKVKGYAGTPGYTAPEMIKGRHYGPSADIFSYGVLCYRMLAGSKPFRGKIDRDLDKAILEKDPKFPSSIFDDVAKDFLSGVLAKRPEERLGCGPRGLDEIKEHPYFDRIDWGLLEAGYIDPPFVPSRHGVNAASAQEIGEFDVAKFRHVKLNERFKATVRRFDFVSASALQAEMVDVLAKADSDVTFEKFAATDKEQRTKEPVKPSGCCTIL